MDSHVAIRRHDAAPSTAHVDYASDDDVAGAVVTQPGGASGGQSHGSAVTVIAADLAALKGFCEGALM